MAQSVIKTRPFVFSRVDITTFPKKRFGTIDMKTPTLLLALALTGVASVLAAPTHSRADEKLDPTVFSELDDPVANSHLPGSKRWVRTKLGWDGYLKPEDDEKTESMQEQAFAKRGVYCNEGECFDLHPDDY